MAAAHTTTQGSHKRQRQQVWLPGLQVWAAVGNQPAPDGRSERPGSMSTTKAASSSHVATPPVLQAAGELEDASPVQFVQASLLAQAQTSEDKLETPTCPICKHRACFMSIRPAVAYNLTLSSCRSDRDRQT